MKKVIMLALICASILIAACSSATVPPPVQCAEPNKIIEGVCCLDQNNNDICDDKETIKVTQEQCVTDSDCELDLCIGCINVEWGKSNPIRPECDRFGTGEYSCKCIKNACSETQKVEDTKITAGNKIRISEENLPLDLEMQKNTRIGFITSEGDETYTINDLQESQIVVYYEKDSFIIKKGTSQRVGSVELVYSGVNPPKNGNFAMIKVIKPEA